MGSETVQYGLKIIFKVNLPPMIFYFVIVYLKTVLSPISYSYSTPNKITQFWLVESNTINPKLYFVGVPIKFPWKRRNFVECTINKKSHDLLVQFVNNSQIALAKRLVQFCEVSKSLVPINHELYSRSCDFLYLFMNLSVMLFLKFNSV